MGAFAGGGAVALGGRAAAYCLASPACRAVAATAESAGTASNVVGCAEGDAVSCALLPIPLVTTGGMSDETAKAALEAGSRSAQAKFMRTLTSADLGIVGDVKQLSGSLQLENGILNVRVDMIEGEIQNPASIVRNLLALAKENGATALRVEGSLANPRLLSALQNRYGMISNGSVDSFVIPVE